MEKTWMKTDNIVLLGDLNCNLLGVNERSSFSDLQSKTRNLLHIFDVFNMQNVIKEATQSWRWSVVPNESSRDFGPCDRFWTQLALRCFLLPTSPPGTALRDGYVGP